MFYCKEIMKVFPVPSKILTKVVIKVHFPAFPPDFPPTSKLIANRSLQSSVDLYCMMVCRGSYICVYVFTISIHVLFFQLYFCYFVIFMCTFIVHYSVRWLTLLVHLSCADFLC